MKVLFLDRSTKLGTIHDLSKRARGGMVSSLRIIPDKLSLAGFECVVLADVGESGTTEHGVRWISDSDQFECDSIRDERFDFLVCNRGVGNGYPEISARRRVLWTHDLPHNGFIEEPKLINAFASTVFMSRYAEGVWRLFYRDIGKSFMIPNGVDRKLFHPREKDLNYMIYASAPNRGLKRLPLIFDAIRYETRNNVRMNAYSNMGSLHPSEVISKDNGNGDGFELDYKSVVESDVNLYEPIPQEHLAEELGRAALMILPSDYPEICSNAILQSLASGTPVITTGKLGSANEWVSHGKNGFVTTYHPVDYLIYQVEIVRYAVRIMGDEKLHRKMIRNAANTDILTWDEVAYKWAKMFNKLY